GRLVAAGYADSDQSPTTPDFVVARYNLDGTPDTSFGSGGRVTTDIGGSDDRAEAVALQPDGKLLVAGSTPSTDVFAPVRYDVNGNLDAGFGSAGKVTTDTSLCCGDEIHALAVEPRGKIIAAGTATTATGADFELIRYKSSGVLDSSFG